MNATEMVEVIGRTGDLFIEDLVVTVQILDVRKAFGRTDFLVTPVDGQKQQWVSETRVNRDRWK
jgi:hypothetical protein